MIELFKYIKGYLCIRVTGFSPERFMNLCSNKGILLWNIHKDADEYYMCLSIDGFFKLRPVVRKTGTKVAIVRRCGLPFLMSRMWKRKIFITGFVFAAVFWLWTSRYIWEIDINGNFTITDDVIIEYLNNIDVVIGMNKSELNIENLEKGLRKEFYEITWTSAKLEGTKLFIEIKENDKIDLEAGYQNDIKQYTASDLVATRKGKIVSIVVRTGIPQVKVGQEVEKGDVLVSGRIPVYQEDGTVRKYNYCNADADILIEYTMDINETISLFYEKKNYTGREKKQYYLKIFGRYICFANRTVPFLSYDYITDEDSLTFMRNFVLPVTFGTNTYREYYTVDTKYSKEEAKKVLNDKYRKLLLTLTEKGVQIIGKDVKIETNDSKWGFRGTLTLVEECTINVPIEEMVIPYDETAISGETD